MYFVSMCSTLFLNCRHNPAQVLRNCSWKLFSSVVC